MAAITLSTFRTLEDMIAPLTPPSLQSPPLPPPAALGCSVPGAHEGGCYGLAFSRTGGLLASGGADKCVRLWEPSTATHTSTLHVSIFVTVWVQLEAGEVCNWPGGSAGRKLPCCGPP